MDHDDEPDAALPAVAEQVLAGWRTLGAPSDVDVRSIDQVMNVLRSCSVRDSHETLVDRALLAAPLPRQPSEGSLPEPDGLAALSLQALALEQLLGRQRIASAVSGLTVALFLALVLWMASTNQVGAGPLVRGPQSVHGATLRRSSAIEPPVRVHSRTSSVPPSAEPGARETSTP
jgi:hypothetical protein